jgi:hypothetical protein
MSIGRRYELLMANAARNISEPRRKELLEAAARWMESPGCPAKTHEELFYMWGAMAGIELVNYSKEVQAQIGGEILEAALDARGSHH